jgi:hypothetical protein
MKRKALLKRKTEGATAVENAETPKRVKTKSCTGTKSSPAKILKRSNLTTIKSLSSIPCFVTPTKMDVQPRGKAKREAKGGWVCQ